MAGMTDQTIITQLTAEECFAALRNVIDPEIYQNIVDLGLVYGVEVGPDNAVDVLMTLTTPHCPMGPQIFENVEKYLLRAGATAVMITISWEPPWTPDMMTDALKRQLGILPGADEEEEPVLPIDLPPPPPKKKGLLGRLFG
jgi:metal-sulfur cluster biosynthetic enzyme